MPYILQLCEDGEGLHLYCFYCSLIGPAEPDGGFCVLQMTTSGTAMVVLGDVWCMPERKSLQFGVRSV